MKKVNEREMQAFRDQHKVSPLVEDHVIEWWCRQGSWLPVYRFKYACKELWNTTKKAFKDEWEGKNG
jgi:hypothetical protein